MTDAQIPDSPDAARAELDQHDTWLQDFAQRQNIHPSIIARINFLNGYLLRDQQINASDGDSPSEDLLP